ncbi:hypothetical protein BC936DRAFT_142814 [Jimgerdemannia flammicorona]|uniref:Uncharacterized protein n=2 Tax=Jimgerdemannia flammicorona TaxID=994334 RepID=A0A433DEQ9_9FUNG|nr:hypothetical protein BC936DRAFT_142814 [Jimgerdemannia flammicorona]RUS28472.1 hypothetical protein BC938DRAFT_481839 [Jimgerdemannia flammicorona]
MGPFVAKQAMSSVLSPTVDPSGRVSERTTCYRQLCLTLANALVAYDYHTSATALNLLCECRETEAHHFWSVAIHVLTHVAHDSNNCLRFLKVVHNRIRPSHVRLKKTVPTFAISNHVALFTFYRTSRRKRTSWSRLYGTRYHLNCTKRPTTPLRRAYIAISPYDANAHLHGYMGLLAIRRWQSEMTAGSNTEDESMDDDDDDDDQSTDGSAEISQTTRPIRNLSTAKNHLLRAFELDMSTDLFLRHYIQLLLAEHNHNDARDIMIRFRDANPSNPIAHKLLFEFLHATHPESDDWVISARAYLLLDPCSPRELALKPLLSYYKDAIGTSSDVVFPISVEPGVPKSIEPGQVAELQKIMIELLLDRFVHGDHDPSMVDKLVYMLMKFKSSFPAIFTTLQTGWGHWFMTYTIWSGSVPSIPLRALARLFGSRGVIPQVQLDHMMKRIEAIEANE